MRKVFVGGNWKSNGNISFIKKHCDEVLNKIKIDNKKIDVVISPIDIHINLVQNLIKNDIHVASQNISLCQEGAFTGEVSAKAIRDLGVNWTLVGHSERRTLFGESNKVVADKVLLAEENGLCSIACIGETREERESNKTISVVQNQLLAIKNNHPDWSKIVLAYEPVWAIGTGLVATPEQAQDVHNEIRNWMRKEVSSKVADEIRIIYGGSVSGKNAYDLIKKEDIDGFLVGGASLKSDFIKVVEDSQRI
jgi:triosephosphate isomerase